MSGVRNAVTQDLDKQAEEDAYFMSVGRYYKDIYPFIKTLFDWSHWQAKLDTTYILDEVTKLKGEDYINLEFVMGDLDTFDIMPFSPYEVHFMDYNADGNDDFIFQSSMGYRGTKAKFYKSHGDHYQLENYFSGMVVDTDMAFRSQAMKFTIYDYPCCDGYVHHLKTYVPRNENDITVYKLEKVVSFMQANLKKLKNLPMEFDINKSVELNKESVAYYHDIRPVYRKFDVSTVTTTNTYKQFHPFAIYPTGSKGVALSSKIEKNEQGVDTLLFVQFDRESLPNKHIYAFDWGDREVRKVQDRSSYEKIYLGWVNKNEVKFTGGDELRTSWGQLMKKGGCLTGGQNCSDGKCGNATGIFNKDPKWQKFLSMSSHSLVPFLLDKFDDISGTKVHTCPFMEATSGEVAVYTLQHVLKVNWFDLDPEYFKLMGQEITTDKNSQIWLERVLQNEKNLEKLKGLFNKYYLNAEK